MVNYENPADRFNNQTFLLSMEYRFMPANIKTIQDLKLEELFLCDPSDKLLVSLPCIYMVDIIDRNGSFVIVKDADILKILIVIDEYIKYIRDYILDGNAQAIDITKRILVLRKLVFEAYKRDVMSKPYTKHSMENSYDDIYDIFQQFDNTNKRDIFLRLKNPPLSQEHLSMLENKPREHDDASPVSLRHKDANDILNFIKS